MGEQLLKQMWWKWICAVVLIGSVFTAMYYPISPGILSVESPDGMRPGESEFYIIGYNTRFSHAPDLQVWLQEGEYYLCPSDVDIIDDTHLKVTLDVPSSLPNNLMDVFVNESADGTLVNLGQLYFAEISIEATQVNEDCHRPAIIQSHAYFSLPFRTILYETIRNLNFHVPMWFAMIVMMMLSLAGAIAYLWKGESRFDDMTHSAIEVGLLFALAGLATGSLWARFTWTNWWTNDPQLNGAALSTLGYLAYFILRRAINDPDKKARISAVYAIFAFVMFYVFIKVLPARADFSLHPNTTDNPSFRDYDVEGKLKTVFYAATIGWIGLASWIFTLRLRLARLTRKRDEEDEA